MHIHVVGPVVTEDLLTEAYFTPYARSDTRVTQSTLRRGPESIESHFDEAMALPDTVLGVIAAAQDGSDAVVIDCMGDPGLAASREATDVLVLGPAQTSMHVAALLGHRFSVISILDAVVPMLEDLATVYGLAGRLASVRTVGIPVLELHDQERLLDALFRESLSAIEDDGAHVIVLGCTSMRGAATTIHDRLAEAGHPGIPVVDPAVTAMKIAEALVDLGLTPSKRSYPTPRAKRIVGHGPALPPSA